jgi:hypothetical protein
VCANNKLFTTELFHSSYFIYLGSKNSPQHFPNTLKLLITEMKSDLVHFC